MERMDQNHWTGSFSTKIGGTNYSVTEDIVFLQKGILWFETITDERPEHYKNTVTCGPAEWIRK